MGVISLHLFLFGEWNRVERSECPIPLRVPKGVSLSWNSDLGTVRNRRRWFKKIVRKKVLWKVNS